MEYAITTEGLTKVYRVRQTTGGKTETKEIKAVLDLNLRICRGELFGLLGVNGAGKTTTIRMLATLLEPTSGTAVVNGFDVLKQPVDVRRSIGCLLPGERSHYWKLTARENLRFFGTLYGIPTRVLENRIKEVLDIVGLSRRADERVENYSTGMRQRLALARAILHDPPILILDEPTAGLDVHSARMLRQMVQDLAASGKTVLLTTHNLQEAEEVCTRVAVIHEGRIVVQDTPAALRALSTGLDVLEVTCERCAPPGTQLGVATPRPLGESETAGKRCGTSYAGISAAAAAEIGNGTGQGGPGETGDLYLRRVEAGTAEAEATRHGPAERQATEDETGEDAIAGSDCLQIEELVKRAVGSRCQKCSVTVSRRDEGYQVVVKGRKIADEFPAIAVTLTNGGWRVTGFNVSRPRLEDVFVELTSSEKPVE
ncbi:MAG: ABC transporter ATP-binding protein [Firmicutes bacterium]|nr:ABC transporter ATP-binding protein [Candidatus Fermentithermobacillaceae bacterium]